MTNILDTFACQVVDLANFGNPWDIYAKLAPYDVETVYFNAQTDALVTKAILEDNARRGLFSGVYFIVPRDRATYADGARFAETCSQRVEELGGMATVAAVLFDNEKTPLEFQAGLCERWDVIRYGRPTLWSVEPFQDRTQNDYPRMLARNAAAGRRLRKVTTQSYFGGMQPLTPRNVVKYLVDRGLSENDLCPTIDPAAGEPAKRAAYLSSALACGTRGAVLYQAGRIP